MPLACRNGNNTHRQYLFKLPDSPDIEPILVEFKSFFEIVRQLASILREDVRETQEFLLLNPGLRDNEFLHHEVCLLRSITQD